jgi:hypothetical protein
MKSEVCAAVAIALFLLITGCTEEIEVPERGLARPEAVQPGKPATPAAAEPVKPLPPLDRDRLKTPWARAKVDDWAKYRFQGRIEKVFRVVDTSGDDVAFEIRTLRDGREILDRKVTLNLRDEEARYKDPTTFDFTVVSEETLVIAGKKIRCTKCDRKFGEMHTVNWFSREVPMDGVVKSIHDGKIMQELLDFGRK